MSDVGARPDDIAIGDCDGDGSQDAMALVRRTRSVRFIPGTDDGFFGIFLPVVELSLPAGHVPGVRLHSSDFDGDGIVDVAIVGRFPDGHAITVIHGVDTGIFGSQTIWLRKATAALALGDVLPEPGVEILTADSTTREIEIIRAEKLGFRAHSVPLAVPLVPGEPLLLAVGDPDGDGAPNVALGPAVRGDLEVFTVNDCPGDQNPSFRRGDVNQDGTVQLADAVALLQRLFAASEALACEDAADADDDGALNLSDAARILAFLFSAGAAPAPPGPVECGEDPTEDELAHCEEACAG